MSNLKDYATSTILVAPSPATSGTTLEVQVGHGARFPATPFTVTAHPPSEYPNLDNCEKLLVTAITGNEFTITRAQGDTTAKSIETGWRISNSLFLADIPVIDSTSVEAAGAVMESDTSTADMDFVVDEDDMSSDSATKVPTQQSVKAYVDANAVSQGGKIADAYTNVNGTDVMFIAHRNAPNLFPEETMEGYKGIVAAGAKAIECDAYLLADGSLGIMHDSTLTRTTTSSGNTADQTAMSWGSLVNDHGSTLGGLYTSKTYPVPYLSDILREFGNKVTLVIEGKNTGACAKIVEELQKYNIATDAAIVQSFTVSELASVVTAGYPAMALGDSINPTTAAAAGVTMAAVSSAASSSYIGTLLAENIEVGVYTVNRQHIRDTFIGYGATFFFSDDPIYLSGTGYLRVTDPFASQTWYHGMLHESTYNHRGVFNNTDRWELTNAERAYVLQGWGSPIGGTPGNTGFTIQANVRFSALTASRWCGIAIFDKDWEWAEDGVSGHNGYHCLLRTEGNLQIYRVTNGVATLLVDQTTAALAINTTYTITLTVTPTGITWQRSGHGSTASTSDTTHRGGYVYFTHRINPSAFFDVTFTDT